MQSAVTSAIAIVVAAVLGVGPPLEPAPDLAPETPTVVPTPIEPVTPPGGTTTPGAPKRTGIPGAPDSPGATSPVPQPVGPTPVVPTPIQPVVPRPVQPETGAPGIGPATAAGKGKPANRGPAKRNLGSLAGPRIDEQPPEGGARCFDLGNRCRAMGIGGIVAASLGGAGVVAGIALVAVRPKPLLDDPSRMHTTRPPGAAVLAVGGALLATGIALIVVGLVKHRRDRGVQARLLPAHGALAGTRLR